MKQINALEKHLNLKLLLRSAHGVHLTPAGEVIYRDARFLFDYSRRSIEQARQAMDDADRMFCVGTSLLNPAKPFMDLWYRVNPVSYTHLDVYKRQVMEAEHYHHRECRAY